MPAPVGLVRRQLVWSVPVLLLLLLLLLLPQRPPTPPQRPLKQPSPRPTSLPP
jgi:hypothetical protein